MLRFLSRLLLPWVRFSVRPADIAGQLGQLPQPVCYVLERHSVLEEQVVQRACARLKMPRPGRPLVAGGSRIAGHSVLALARQVGLLRARLDRRPPPVLQSMLAAARADPSLDVTLLPVTVYWGRRPERESGWLDLLLSEDWTLSSRVRRLLTVILNGRNTLVEFGQAVTLRSLIPGDTPDLQASRRIARNLMATLDAGRTAYIGPDLSHRRTLRTQVLRTQGVRAQVAQQARERKLPRRKVFEEAQRMFDEIAADYSPAFVQFMDRVLKRLWTRIYDGVEVAHGRTLAAIAPGNELVYVPCHRSTMDDLLMPYAVYTQGFVIPHIAAGLNLNLPVVGPLLRKGGAFFMRRSFRGNALYTVVFMNYLGAIMARGHPLQYFIEGGRSRTGRLLQPKTGMLSMTLRSYLRQPVRPVVFVPVYLGYERVIEADSYVGELSGKPKEKETLWGFLRSLRRLRENFGFVHVNIGEPIPLQPLLDEHVPQWRAAAGSGGKPPAVNAAVDELAPRIMREINAAASVTPVNLLGLVLLATARQVMLEADLVRQLEVYLQLLRSAPYSPRVTVTQLDPAGIIEAGTRLEVLQRGDGGVVQLHPKHAAAMPYYRNNVLHVVAIPSLLACCFQSNVRVATTDLHRLAWRIYPYIAAELFLRWDESGVPAVVDAQLAAMEQAGLLRTDEAGGQWFAPAVTSPAAMQLSLLAQPTLQTIERYYLAIALLRRAGSGNVTQAELEKRCQQMAQRMLQLYGFHSPEFHDRALFEGFLALLRRRGVLRTDAAGRLLFDEVLDRVAEDAQLVLSEQLRHSILQVVHG